MKKIIFAFYLALLQVCAFAQTPFTAPWGFNYSAPTGAPSALGTRVRFDITTGRIYAWSPDALNWQLQGYTIDQISGTSAPAYAPVRGQSWFAVNGDTLPRLYQYTGTGTVWKCLNCSDGKTYTAGTGIALSGPNSTVINNAGDLSATNELNTGFDISGGNLRIIDAGATRTVAITSIAPDQSTTNELQTIDTFLVSGSNLLLSLTQDNQPAKTITLPASGITALTGDVTASGPGSAVATIAAGAVTASKLASMGASSGQVLGWNGSVWGPTAAGVSGSGTTGFLPKFSSSTGLTNSAFDENSAGYITTTARGITIGDAVSSAAAGNGYRLLRGTLSGGYFSNGSQLIFQTSTSHDIYFATNATERMRILAGGNVGIGLSTGISARLHTVGAGATNATTNFLFANSTPTAILTGLDNGYIRLGNAGTTAPRFYSGSDASGGDVDLAGLNMVFNSRVTNVASSTGNFLFTGTNLSHTTGTNIVFRVNRTIAMPAGNAVQVFGAYDYTINNTGAQSGSVTGLTVRASEVSLQGITHNLFDLQVNGGSMFRVTNTGSINLLATNTSTGTTGAQTINRPSGTVNFAAGATSLVVTNSLVATSSLVFATVRTNDATATIKNVVPGAGSFTINLTAAATAETSVGFFVIN